MYRLTAVALAATLAFGHMTTAFANDTTSEITSATQVAALERFADRPFATIIAKEAAAHGVPLNLAHAVINIESSYRSSVTGAAGEVGLMQIKPATARGMGYRGSTKALYDPATNIKWGMRYLAGAVQRGLGEGGRGLVGQLPGADGLVWHGLVGAFAPFEAQLGVAAVGAGIGDLDGVGAFI